MPDYSAVALEAFVVIVLVAAIVQISFSAGYKAGHRDAQQERAAYEIYKDIVEEDE